MANIISSGSGSGYLKAIKALTETMKDALNETKSNTEWAADAAERVAEIQGEATGLRLKLGEHLDEV